MSGTEDLDKGNTVREAWDMPLHHVPMLVKKSAMLPNCVVCGAVLYLGKMEETRSVGQLPLVQLAYVGGATPIQFACAHHQPDYKWATQKVMA